MPAGIPDLPSAGLETKVLWALTRKEMVLELERLRELL